MLQLNNIHLGKADVPRGGNHMYRCRMKIAVFSKDAALIFCGSRQRIGTFPSEEFEAADEFWETPFVRDYIKVRLKRIMEQIKLGCDYYMPRTYLDTVIDSSMRTRPCNVPRLKKGQLLSVGSRYEYP